MSGLIEPPPAAVESAGKKRSRDIGIYTYSRVAANLMVLATLMIATRLYGKPGYAYVVSLFTLYESGLAIGSLGLADAVFYLMGRNPERASHVVRQTSFLLLSTALPVTAIVVAVGAFFMEMQFGAGLWWLALALLIDLPTQPAVNQLIASDRARLASALYVGFAAFRPLAVAIPAVAGLPIGWIPILMAITSVFRLVAHLLIVGRVFPLRDGEPARAWLDGKVMGAILRFAFPAGLAMLGGTLNPLIDKFAVEKLRGEIDLALYGAAGFEIPLVTMIPYAIGAVMQAHYVRLLHAGKHAELHALWLQTVRKTAVIVLPLAWMFIALAAEAVEIVAGAEYVAATVIFQIFTLTLLQRVAAYGPMLQAIGEMRSLLVTSTLLIVSNLALAYPFIKWFGFPGAAIATLVANVPPFLFTLWRISLGLNVRIRDVMPWRHYLEVIALSAALGGVTWLGVRELPLVAGARFAVGAIGFLVTYFVLGRLFRLIADEDVDYLRQWLTLRMLRK